MDISESNQELTKNAAGIQKSALLADGEFPSQNKLTSSVESVTDAQSPLLCNKPPAVDDLKAKKRKSLTITQTGGNRESIAFSNDSRKTSSQLDTVSQGRVRQESSSRKSSFQEWVRKRSSTLGNVSSQRNSKFGLISEELAIKSPPESQPDIATIDIDNTLTDPQLSTRKRSSTSTVPNTVTTLMQNTSIFKPDSRGGRPENIQVITHRFSLTEDELIAPLHSEKYGHRNSEQNQIGHSGGHGHIKAYSSICGTDRGKVYHVDRRRTSTLNNKYLEVVISPNYCDVKKCDAVSSDPRKREHSLVSVFLSSLEPRKEKQSKRSLEQQSNVKRRWFTLRNAIAFFNILIIAIAVLVMAIVSYYAGMTSTYSAIAAMSNVTINDVTLKLDDILGGAENANVFSESLLTLPEFPIGKTAKIIRNFYYYMTESDLRIDQIYAVAPNNMFAGVSTFRDNTGIIVKDVLQIRYLNTTTNPYRLIYNTDTSCAIDNNRCIMRAFDGTRRPFANTTYVATSRPFFQQALLMMRPGWSSIYLYSDAKLMGLTAFRPIINRRTLQLLCATDVTLDRMSGYLTEIASLIAGDNKETKPLIFIIERSGLFVATSDMKAIPVVDHRTKQRMSIYHSPNPSVQASLHVLIDSFGSIDNIQWPQNGNPLVYEDNSGHVIWSTYSRQGKDIDWIIAAYIPFAAFNGRLIDAHLVMLPLISIAVIAVATLLAIVATRAIGKPLKRIAEQMLNIADLNIDDDDEESMNSNSDADSGICGLKNPFNNLKELQYLQNTMSAMKMGLKSFAKYVPLDIVTLLVKMKREAVLGVDEMELTVFFSDIADFTRITESLNPKELVELMSEYLSEMSDFVLQSQGIVDKYIGDAIMAFWNAPISVKDHPTIVCATALKSQQRLAELRKKWCNKGYPAVRSRIGINTGMAFVGNLGSKTRLNYTCLGDTVNLASRLEGLNKRYGTEILISDHTKSKIHQEYFVTRPLDIVVVKGKSISVKIHELVGFRKLLPLEMIHTYSIYEDAFNAFCGRKFVDAIRGFRYFSSQFPDDISARKRIEECEEFISCPPPPNWSPLVILDEK